MGQTCQGNNNNCCSGGDRNIKEVDFRKQNEQKFIQPPQPINLKK